MIRAEFALFSGFEVVVEVDVVEGVCVFHRVVDSAFLKDNVIWMELDVVAFVAVDDFLGCGGLPLLSIDDFLWGFWEGVLNFLGVVVLI